VHPLVWGRPAEPSIKIGSYKAGRPIALSSFQHQFHDAGAIPCSVYVHASSTDTMMNLGCTRRKHFCSFLRARCVLKPSLNHPATCCLIQLPSLPYPTLALPTPAPAQGRPRGWRAAASSLEYTNATCAKTGWAMRVPDFGRSRRCH